MSKLGNSVNPDQTAPRIRRFWVYKLLLCVQNFGSLRLGDHSESELVKTCGFLLMYISVSLSLENSPPEDESDICSVVTDKNP